MSQGRKKHMARPGLEPRTSRTLCEHSDHWATEPHGRPVTISPCLIRFVPKSARNWQDSPFAARSLSMDPHWATKCHRGEKSTWSDRDSNPGPLAHRASTLTTELPSHTVDLSHKSNSLQDIRQNHWTMKYRSQWHTFILRSNVVSYWLIIPKYDVHTSNSLQDTRQNHWTMKYRSQWPTYILRSNVRSYRLIIPKYDVHTSNSLQDIRQNHWTMNYRSHDLNLFLGQTSGHTDS